MLCQDFAPYLGSFRRRGHYGSPVSAHYFTTEGLLLITDLNHIYFAVQAKVRTGHGKRCAPLACAGFRCDTFQPLVFCVVRLGDGRIQLVAATGVVALKLVVDFCRGLELFFQTICTNERRRPVHLVKISNFFWNFNIGGLIVQFLAYQFFAEYTAQFFGCHRLMGAGIQQRSGFVFHVCADIVPALGHLAFFKINFVGDFLFF